MTTTMAATRRQCAVTATDQVRARQVVLHHARDAADAAELLAMLGLGNDQDDQLDSTPPRGRGGLGGGLAGRQSGGVHPLSAATEARLASHGSSTNNAPADEPAAPAVEPAAAVSTTRSTTRSRAAVDRRCAGCGVLVVPQTLYRLDPAGYRARGIKLLAAKGRCHSCYNRQRRPAAPGTSEPQNPRQCEQCQRPMVSTRRFSADPDRWRGRGWVAHAAHGVCRPCRSAAEEPGRRAARRAARQEPTLCHLIDQLIALRQQVGQLRHSYPDDEHLVCVSTALAQARKHLDDASARLTEGSVGTPNQVVLGG